MVLFLASMAAALLVIGGCSDRLVKTPPVEMISREDALQKGYYRYRREFEQLLPFDIAELIAQCQKDLEQFSGGKAKLVSIYRSREGLLILQIENYEDEDGQSVMDKNMAYVYDPKTRSIVGKFWAPI